MNQAQAARAEADDPVHKIGLFLLSLFFFLNYSRVLDLTVPSLHLPLIVGVGLYASTALAGGLQRAFATLPGKLLVAMTGIMILASLFGAWKGGSSKLLSGSMVQSVSLVLYSGRLMFDIRSRVQVFADDRARNSRFVDDRRVARR